MTYFEEKNYSRKYVPTAAVRTHLLYVRTRLLHILPFLMMLTASTTATRTYLLHKTAVLLLHVPTAVHTSCTYYWIMMHVRKETVKNRNQRRKKLAGEDTAKEGRLLCKIFLG